MTVSSQITKTIYSGNGVTKVFPITFEYNGEADIGIYFTSSIGAVNKVATNYEIDTENNQVTYPVDTLINPIIPVGTKLTLVRETLIDQSKNLENQGYFTAEEAEAAFDKITRIAQELAEKISRCIKYSADKTPTALETETYLLTLETLKDLALSYSNSASASALSAMESKDTATTKASEAEASAAAALSSENNSTNSATEAEASANSASDSASSALTSANNASISESNASVSASSAEASATNAAISEANSAISEDNAAISAANALASELNAAALLDAFDDRYLGSKTEDPALDNDGNALVIGALYWNSVAKKLYSYDGALWNELAGGGGGIKLWTTATGYIVDNIVHINNKIYKALEIHTSGVFATDLAAGKWQLLGGSEIGFGGTKAAPLSIGITGIAFTGNAPENIYFIESTAGAIDVTANPQITAPSFAGQKLKIVGRNAIKTIQLNPGNGLDLRGPWLSDLGNVLNLYADTDLLWCEDNRSL